MSNGNHSKNQGVLPHKILKWLAVALPNEIYHYKLLDSNTDDIRLLTLLPSKDETTEIEGFISHVSLARKPDYEALSYAWGDPNEEAGNIYLEGKPFPVTPSLETALRQLRLAENPRVLWVDALSINQIDDEEKTHQVQRMKGIYQTASRVVVWLGKASEDSDLAMELIADIHQNGPRNYSADLENSASWEALRKLYRRSWFGRVWVLQETAVGRLDPEVRVGNKWLSWEAFESARRFIENQIAKNDGGSTSKLVVSVVKATAVAIHNTRHDLWSNLPLPNLETLLSRTMTFHSTDPRDKVFALLGLALENDRLAILPDYSKSLKEVYTELAVYLLSKDINMLYFNTDSPYHELPSWVPDWSWWSRRWPLWTTNSYNAGGKTVRSGRFSNDLKTFTVPGLLIDQISATDEFVPRGNDVIFYNASHVSLIVENIETLLRKRREEQPNLAPLSPEKSDALWQTLVASKPATTQTHPPYELMFHVQRGRSSVPETFRPDLAHDPEQRRSEFIEPFEFKLQGTMSDQRFFITKNGRIGIGPRHLMAGDPVVILWGSDMPCVIREPENVNVDDDDGHRFLGAAYVYGVMSGEAFEGIETHAQLQERSELFLLR